MQLQGPGKAGVEFTKHPALGLIREMTAEDLPEVMAIEAAEKAPWSHDLFAAELELAHGWSYVYKKDAAAKVSGFIIGTIVADEAEIRKLAVSPEFRRQKIATILLEKGLAFLKKKTAASCFLELRESNKAAFCLYEKHGFNVVARRKNYYKNQTEDAFIMQKNLRVIR